MSDEEQVDIEFDVDDRVTPKLSRMEKAVGRLGGVVDRAAGRFTGMAANFAGLAGFFALGPAISGAQAYISHLDKISDLTGIAADKVAGISNALEDSGVQAGTVENVFAKLVKKTAQAGEGNKSLIKMARQYGVAIKEGPESALIAVSGLLEKGKINAGQMQRILGVSSDDAADLADALAQGPGELQKKIEEATKKNHAFNDEAMGGMQRYQNAVASIGTAWHRLTGSILIKLAPGLEAIADKMSKSIDGWIDGAERFGNYLVKHMDQLIEGAKTYAKIMAATTVLKTVTGHGVGHWAMKGVGMLQKGASGVGALSQVMSMGAGRGALSVVGEAIKGFFKLRPIISWLTKLTPLGAIIAVVAGGFMAITRNVGGISDRLKDLFGRIWGNLQGIGSTLGKLFSPNGPFGKLIEFVGYMFVSAVERLGEALNLLLTIVRKIIDLIPDIGGGVNPIDRMKDARDSYAFAMRSIERKHLKGAERAAAIAKAQQYAMDIAAGKVSRDANIVAAKELPKPGAPKSGANGPQVYQDFRGSRFDIKQAFSDGYDPDRVAVAFANDLSSMGERKLQSGFSPMFSVR